MSFLSGLSVRSALSFCLKSGALLAVLVLGACGTTSKLQLSDGDFGASEPNLKAFEHVYVQDFKSAYTDEKHDAAEMKVVGKEFSDLIAQKVEATDEFSSVRRVGSIADAASLANKDAAPAALVSGTITRYDDGNALARFMFGMGAGSSYFEADVIVTDARTGIKIGEVKVDKNSWVMGGMIAATQTAKSYMPGAAARIAQELKAVGTTK